MSHVFISYSRADSQWVNHIRDALVEKGFLVWIDQEIGAGRPWYAAINVGLSSCNAVVVAISPRVASASFVVQEVSTAEKLGKPLIPVQLEPCALPAALARLNKLQFIDLARDFRAGIGQLSAALIQNGLIPNPPVPIPPPPLSLSQVIEGNWIADVQFSNNFLQLTIGISSIRQFVGQISKPAPMLPELFPYQGTWRVSGNELVLEGQWFNMGTGLSQPWTITFFFSRISQNELYGFTLPERSPCTWRRTG